MLDETFGWAYEALFDSGRGGMAWRSWTLILIAVLAGFVLWVGLYPKPFLDRIEPTAKKIVEQLNTSVDPEGDVATDASEGGD